MAVDVFAMHGSMFVYLYAENFSTLSEDSALYFCKDLGGHCGQEEVWIIAYAVINGKVKFSFDGNEAAANVGAKDWS